MVTRAGSRGYMHAASVVVVTALYSLHSLPTQCAGWAREIYSDCVNAREYKMIDARHKWLTKESTDRPVSHHHNKPTNSRSFLVRFGTTTIPDGREPEGESTNHRAKVRKQAHFPITAQTRQLYGVSQSPTKNILVLTPGAHHWESS